MKWFGKVLHREPPEHVSVITPQDRADLAATKATHRQLLTRADEAIRVAMAHADEVFAYRGPERRRNTR